VLEHVAAQGKADYRDRAEMPRRSVAIAKAEGKYIRTSEIERMPTNLPRFVKLSTGSGLP
jgi:hypothetical protein